MNKVRSKRQTQTAGRNPRRKVTRTDADAVIRQMILWLFKIQKQVSADDVHEWLDIPKDCMQCVRHAFRGLQRQGVIQDVKLFKTARSDQHKNRIALWELVRP